MVAPPLAASRRHKSVFKSDDNIQYNELRGLGLKNGRPPYDAAREAVAGTTAYVRRATARADSSRGSAIGKIASKNERAVTCCKQQHFASEGPAARWRWPVSVRSVDYCQQGGAPGVAAGLSWRGYPQHRRPPRRMCLFPCSGTCALSIAR